jgi:ribonuclease BN (tRNA processing enzyme)|tara:strand:+ start:126 stop:935 length:810 start_codon:yes stop_codon:yes gene_type:complete
MAMLYSNIVMHTQSQSDDTITFLGTGGARFMITTQILASGGLWLNLSGTEILIDPGPGCIVQATKRKLRADKLSAIILSHRHLDHAADVNIMVEAMTRGGFKQHGWLLAPADALNTEPVIFSYLRSYLEGVEILEEGKSYSIGNVTFTTPIRHIHPVETYGMRFTTAEHTFSYIADTRYFEGLRHSYDSELLIINVVFVEPRPPVDHLSLPDAESIITEIKPKVAILTHFGMTIWQAKPGEIARRLSQETGVRVLAARDGMRFEMSQLD